jgi:hypothetical protein
LTEVRNELKRKTGKHHAINTLDLPYALEQLIKDVWGPEVELTDDTKNDMVEKSKKDIYGVQFSQFLQKKQEGMDNEMKTIAKEFMDDLYDELELEDVDDEDATSYEHDERKLRMKKKVRMTDWA